MVLSASPSRHRRLRHRRFTAQHGCEYRRIDIATCQDHGDPLANLSFALLQQRRVARRSSAFGYAVGVAKYQRVSSHTPHQCRMERGHNLQLQLVGACIRLEPCLVEVLAMNDDLSAPGLGLHREVLLGLLPSGTSTITGRS